LIRDAQAVSVESLGAIAIGQFAARLLCVCSGVKMLLGYSKQVFWGAFSWRKVGEKLL
jgi:hypothetical protein